MACHAMLKTWPSGLSHYKHLALWPRFLSTWEPQAMFLTQHGKPWLRPIPYIVNFFHRILIHVIFTLWFMTSSPKQEMVVPGFCFHIKTVIPSMGIHIMKIKWSWPYFIFIMGIPIMARTHLHIEISPTSLAWTMLVKTRTTRTPAFNFVEAGGIKSQYYWVTVNCCHKTCPSWCNTLTLYRLICFGERHIWFLQFVWLLKMYLIEVVNTACPPPPPTPLAWYHRCLCAGDARSQDINGLHIAKFSISFQNKRHIWHKRFLIILLQPIHPSVC